MEGSKVGPHKEVWQARQGELAVLETISSKEQMPKETRARYRRAREHLNLNACKRTTVSTDRAFTRREA
jgi:hypothetical protein